MKGKTLPIKFVTSLLDDTLKTEVQHSLEKSGQGCYLFLESPQTRSAQCEAIIT